MSDEKLVSDKRKIPAAQRRYNITLLFKRFTAESSSVKFMVLKEVRNHLYAEIIKLMQTFENNEMNASHPIGRLMFIK